ncbi:MAG: ribonuclease H-like domain-containing protein, partial [Desulfatiglandales bacterium]
TNEVGGWKNSHLMRISVACLYDLSSDSYKFFREEDIPRLIEELYGAELVVGFNIRDFDYKVLSFYTQKPLNRLPTLDILQAIYKACKRKVSLSSVSKATLNRDKIGDGLDAIKWFREGNFEKLSEYCKVDVELTKDLYLYGVKNGYVKFFDKKINKEVKVYIDW